MSDAIYIYEAAMCGMALKLVMTFFEMGTIQNISRVVEQCRPFGLMKRA